MSKLGFSKPNSYKRCKNAAMYLLGMREYSRQELLNKLKRKDYVQDLDLEKLLDELEAGDYLNNERFVESFVRYRITRGQGAIKISNELRNRGICNSLIKRNLNNDKINWYDLAAAQLEKKYGQSKSEDFKEKAKRMRFLSSRGFTSDVVREIVK